MILYLWTNGGKYLMERLNFMNTEKKPTCKKCYFSLYDNKDKCKYCIVSPPIIRIENENEVLKNCKLGFSI